MVNKMTSNQETQIQQKRDEEDIHFVVVAGQQPTQEKCPITNLCKEEGEVTSNVQQQSNKQIEEFDLTEALQSFEDDPLAKELECSQETCTSRPGRLLKKVRSLPVRDVETFKRKISPPPKQKTTKKREHGNLPKHDFFSALRSAQQKVFDSFEEELQAYSSFQKVSLNRKHKGGFTSSHTITKRMTERERSRSKDRSSTGSSYHRMPQEDKVTLTKDLSRKIIFAAAKQQNRIVKLSGCQQQASEKNINIESKQNSLKSRKRKRTTIESTGSDKIDIDVDYEPIQKRRVC